MKTDSGFMKVYFVTALFVHVVQSIFKLSVVISAVTLIMVFVLRLGEWTIPLLNNTSVIRLCSISLMASVLLCIFHSIVSKPIYVFVDNIRRKKVLVSAMAGANEEQAYMLNFYTRIVGLSNRVSIPLSVLTGIVAYFAHDFLMTAFGNPIADILTLLIMFVGQNVFGLLLFRVVSRGLREEDPDLFDYFPDFDEKYLSAV